MRIKISKRFPRPHTRTIILMTAVTTPNNTLFHHCISLSTTAHYSILAICAVRACVCVCVCVCVWSIIHRFRSFSISRILQIVILRQFLFNLHAVFVSCMHASGLKPKASSFFSKCEILSQYCHLVTLWVHIFLKLILFPCHEVCVQWRLVCVVRCYVLYYQITKHNRMQLA